VLNSVAGPYGLLAHLCGIPGLVLRIRCARRPISLSGTNVNSKILFEGTGFVPSGELCTSMSEGFTTGYSALRIALTKVPLSLDWNLQTPPPTSLSGSRIPADPTPPRPYSISSRLSKDMPFPLS
jgi:hypothetical protein